jgi:outer membrane protein assembly factor BamA
VPTRVLVRLLAALFLCASAVTAAAQDPAAPQTLPILRALVVNGASVYTRDDVLWLLSLRVGAPLPVEPPAVAGRLEERYEKDGYDRVKVSAAFDEATGELTLTVKEPRIDDIRVEGVSPDASRRIASQLEKASVRVGDVYNRKRVAAALRQILAPTEGALGAGDITLDETSGRGILVVPIHREDGHFTWSLGTEGREDLFSPVDGFNLALGFSAVAYDASGRHHTFFAGHAGYKISAERPTYSFGMEQRLFHEPRIFVGAEVHDLTASDDMWRLNDIEQTVAALWKNTYRDYYRRRGTQVEFGMRPEPHQEFMASFRWDRHEAIANETDYSFVKDDYPFRPNPPVTDKDLRSVVFAYSFDTRGLSRNLSRSYQRHLLDDLFSNVKREHFGWRADWTTELSDHGLGGDVEFARHILNTRGTVPIMPRQSVAARMILGFSSGELPLERQFAIGGVGSVHGYKFKEATGTGMTLFNAEYRFDLARATHDDNTSAFRALVFFDAGKITKPYPGSTSDWLNGIGFGVQTGGVRFEFGYKLDDIPRSFQMLVRLAAGF